MRTEATPIDGIFRALSDPTRRVVLERLCRSPGSVSELAEPFDMALPSFVEHLKILEGCGLVRSTKVGRVRTYRLVPKRLRLAEDWLSQQRVIWERRLDQLDSYLLDLKGKKS
jgi:DNA-binding transcriptional ArsR family regulator